MVMADWEDGRNGRDEPAASIAGSGRGEQQPRSVRQSQAPQERT
jgi:hypothetical protein